MPTWLTYLCIFIAGGSLGVLVMTLGLLAGRETMREEQRMEKFLRPMEDQFHKYPVLRIPTGKKNDQLIIGMEKARAIITYYEEIKKFVDKHRIEVKA